MPKKKILLIKRKKLTVLKRKKPILAKRKKPILVKKYRKRKPLYVLLRKKYKLAYSKIRDDKHKVYGLYIFNPHFLDIIAAKCTSDIEEAKKRVTITNDGRYMYEPSKEYINFLKRHYKSLKLNEPWQQNLGSK